MPALALKGFEVALHCLLYHLFDVIIFGSFLQTADQIHDWHIEGGDTEGHTSELPIQLRDDLAHSLGSTSRSSDGVLDSPMAIMPQLPRAVTHSLLGAVMARTVVMSSSTMRKLSQMTWTKMAKQLVV